MFSFPLLFSASTLISVFSHSQPSSKSNLVGIKEGFAVHGPNNFNGVRIVNFGNLVNFGPTVQYQIAVWNETGFEEELITDTTDKSSLVATTTFYGNNIFPFWPLINDSFKNIPINEVGVLYIGSLNVADRIQPIKYSDLVTPGTIHLSKGTSTDITLEEWNKANGQLTVKYLKHSNSYRVRLDICGFSKSLYSVYEIGINNAFTEDSTLFGVAAGGLPNIILTDKNGYGTKTWEQKWNPINDCSTGDICPFTISVVYHWDYAKYGAAADLRGMGLGVGITASSHLWFPTFGTLMQEPNTEYKGPKCYKK